MRTQPGLTTHGQLVALEAFMASVCSTSPAEAMQGTSHSLQRETRAHKASRQDTRWGPQYELSQTGLAGRMRPQPHPQVLDDNLLWLLGGRS